MSSKNVVETDVLIIGGGTAGCFAAIKAREQGVKVIIVDKGYTGKSGSSIAASGSWMVFNPEWEHHFDAATDFVNMRSEYINNRQWSGILLKESWAAFEDLVNWGVEFPVDPDQMKDYWVTHFIGPHGAKAVSQSIGSIPLRHRKMPPVLRKQASRVGVKIMDRIMVTDLLLGLRGNRIIIAKRCAPESGPGDWRREGGQASARMGRNGEVLWPVRENMAQPIKGQQWVSQLRP